MAAKRRRLAMARLENDSAQRLWNNDRRGSSVHNVTRIHDPNIYLSTIRFTWSVIYGTRGRREKERWRRRGKRETVGPVIISSLKHRSNTGHRSYISWLYRPALVTLCHERNIWMLDVGCINRRRLRPSGIWEEFQRIFNMSHWLFNA